ncbi:hypothetical protein BDY19DRAFT_940269 [Irpex rosettiformis]|uniref:Uncharacterized protein n=1 Tax=Irpex rosettiformis TaxID=378272 RepID=A0ACB8U8G6_9APHY|nr:hypothetical protein BDY19DRAFT_940269 [Irpex rosettiformis]
MGESESRGFGQLQHDMIHVHSIYKLGYDKIVQVLAEPPMDDLSNFLGYCSVWAAGIIEHHDNEELFLFPFLNQNMDFSGEAAQHKVIHDILDQLVVSIQAAKEDHAKFKPGELKELMEKFREPFFTHLDDEVAHISAEKIKSAGVDEQELADMLKKLEKHAVESADQWTVLPFMRGHTQPEFKDTWPVLPWFLRKVVIPYILAKRYSGYWKYCPYAMS